jgi:hypothetical protein
MVFLEGLFAGVLGALLGALVLIALGSKEFLSVRRSIHGKIWGTPVVSTDPETI